MFESRHRSGGGSSANRWLIVAGAGLVILAFVARMLLDIGHTKVSDLAGVAAPRHRESGLPPPAPAPPADTIVTPPAAHRWPPTPRPRQRPTPAPGRATGLADDHVTRGRRRNRPRRRPTSRRR